MNSSIQTLALTDYKMMTPTLARVIIACTGNPSKKQMAEMIRAKFDNLATPVEGSFKPLPNGAAVGFIRANTEIRVVDDKELKASYRVMSSNIMMDNHDKSLWSMQESSAGKFLARHGQEDLGELVNASVNTKPRVGIPALRHLRMDAAVKREFATYVSAKTGEMAHGHVIDVSRDGSKIQVVNASTGATEVVASEMVTDLMRPPLPKAFKVQAAQAGLTTEEKGKEAEYWRLLYNYNREYMNMVIDQVNEGTFL